MTTSRTQKSLLRASHRLRCAQRLTGPSKYAVEFTPFGARLRLVRPPYPSVADSHAADFCLIPAPEEN
jgi:hypothetical protein